MLRIGLRKSVLCHLVRQISFGFHVDVVLKESVIRDIWSGQEASLPSGRNSRAAIKVGKRVK